MCYRVRAVRRHWPKGRPKHPDWRGPRAAAIAGSVGACSATRPPCASIVRIWDDPTFPDRGDARRPCTSQLNLLSKNDQDNAILIFSEILNPNLTGTCRVIESPLRRILADWMSRHIGSKPTERIRYFTPADGLRFCSLNGCDLLASGGYGNPGQCEEVCLHGLRPCVHYNEPEATLLPPTDRCSR
jgi:hypothetical protein